MSIAELLAKKRAAAASNTTAPVEEKKETPPAVEETKPAVVENKPLTFAEKLALKKAQQQQATAVVSAPAKVEELAISISSQITEVAEKIHKEIDIPIVTDDPVVQQKYADIKLKIEELEEKMGDDLKVAMTSLKKALHENSDACAHMLDQDIGKMVVALRRMTMQDVIEVKEGKGTKKPKASTMKDLTAEQLMAGLEEL